LKYATAMDSVSTMQASVRQELGDMIQSKGVMDVQRYNALNKIIDDTAQLETAKATPEEVAFVKEVAEKQKEEVNKIKNTYQALAKDYVTPKVFNKVKKAVETDPKVKKRYDSLMVELKKDNPGE
jgi:type VI protein secretion system component VasK